MIRPGRLKRRGVIGHPVVRAIPDANAAAVVTAAIRRRGNEIGRTESGSTDEVVDESD